MSPVESSESMIFYSDIDSGMRVQEDRIEKEVARRKGAKRRAAKIHDVLGTKQRKIVAEQAPKRLVLSINTEGEEVGCIEQELQSRLSMLKWRT